MAPVLSSGRTETGIPVLEAAGGEERVAGTERRLDTIPAAVAERKGL
ncbi:hypothetical protein GX411_00625 [Candidatus Fermentibacteria bacterium]|nr:hypothetical protein [Candidatus Fermentibacteria bacterium]